MGLFDFFKKNTTTTTKPEVKDKYSRSFLGAGTGPLTDIGFAQHINTELQSLPTLRGRCRQLAINSPVISRALALWADNIVGPKGIEMRPQVKRKNGSLDSNTNTIIANGWEKFCKSNGCDVTKSTTLAKMAEVVLRTVATDGEAFIIKKRGMNYGSHGFALQLISAEQVDDKYNTTLDTGNTVYQGIEINDVGAVVAYHVWNSVTPTPLHTQVYRTRLRIPAEDMIHVFDRKAPNQLRGYPWFANAILSVHQLDQYNQASLEMARLASIKSVYGVLPPNADGLSDEDLDYISKNVPRKITPGQMELYPEGMQIGTIDWNTPNSNQPEFVKVQLQLIASGLGISYAALANNLESINFSSMKYAAQHDQTAYAVKQQWLVDVFYSPVFEEWLTTGIATGRIPLSLSKVDEYKHVTWHPKSWQSVNPLETVRTAEAYNRMGIKSKKQICGELGLDFESQLQQIAAEEELITKLNVQLASPLEVAEVMQKLEKMDQPNTKTDLKNN